MNIHSLQKVKLYLFLFIFSILILISGGRLVSSDEVSMYLTIESLVQHGTLYIHHDNPPNSTIVDGKAYTWYEAGNITSGIPMYFLSNTIASVLSLPESMKSIVTRAGVSLTNSFIGAWIAVLFFTLCTRFGLKIHAAISMSLILTLSTFILPYYKLFMREPTLALCILGGFMYLLPTGQKVKRNHSLIIAGVFIGYGILTKLVFVLNLIPFLLFIIWDTSSQKKITIEKIKLALIFLIPVAIIGFGGTGLYNYLRFGNPYDNGYPDVIAFNTPIYVGLFGLLLSPGKGIIWFAPIMFLFIPAWKYFRRFNLPEANLIVGLFFINLLLYSIFVAWGGDGSWGPRYLVPFLPILMLPIAVYYNQATRLVKKIFFLLVLAGIIIQIGGVTIYPGVYLREIGEYPYQRNFDDPEFLHKAHFIPNYSPIIGHWRMLTRNFDEHITGEYPLLRFNNTRMGDRLPIPVEDQSKLQHTMDFWFTYALYTGISTKIILVLVIMLSLITGATGLLLRNSLSYQTD